MSTRFPLILFLLMLVGFGGACGKRGRTDYGQPVAQFLQEDVAVKAKALVGKKITVKGTVARIDVSDTRAARIHLAGGIQCNLGRLQAMAQSCKVGDTVYVDGFLERCAENDILLDPAILRDPSAPFSPE